MAPALIVVSGPPGAGKTTLAHQLAQAVGCPAVCRDEIKGGIGSSAGWSWASRGSRSTPHPATGRG
jgi:cytidylate kinase